MRKKEILWREILYQATEKRKTEFTQKDLADKFGFSLSTVFNALKIPRQQGAIVVSGRNFQVADAEKFLYIWATQRNLSKEIIYKANIEGVARDIEGNMPPSVIFACCSAYFKKYKEAPADYDKLYVYMDKNGLEKIKERFKEKRGDKYKKYANLFVLQSDPYLKKFGAITPDVQTFVDLWNLKDWYAKEFLSALKNRILP